MCRCWVGVGSSEHWSSVKAHIFMGVRRDHYPEIHPSSKTEAAQQLGLRVVATQPTPARAGARQRRGGPGSWRRVAAGRSEEVLEMGAA